MTQTGSAIPCNVGQCAHALDLDEGTGDQRAKKVAQQYPAKAGQESGYFLGMVMSLGCLGEVQEGGRSVYAGRRVVCSGKNKNTTNRMEVWMSFLLL